MKDKRFSIKKLSLSNKKICYDYRRLFTIAINITRLDDVPFVTERYFFIGNFRQ